jgi:hypothetical protein
MTDRINLFAASVQCPFCKRWHTVELRRWSVVPVVAFCDAGDGGCDQAFGVSGEVIVKTRIHRIEGFDGPRGDDVRCPKCDSDFIDELPLDPDHAYLCGACGHRFDTEGEGEGEP